MMSKQQNVNLLPAIEVTNLCKRFGSKTVLDNISYQIPTGTVFGLLGENGAGKTTTIKTLIGLLQPNSGDARVLGLSSKTEGARIRRQIGYVPEQPVLYDWMTVNEIGWFTSGFYPQGYLETYYDLVRKFDLPPKQKLKKLSKGMLAKVSLSLAMSHNPQLLIMDEPTSGLDTLVRRSFLESMVDLAADGKTVFLSSHQINEVERVADMIAIMDSGKILTIDSLDNMKQRLEQWVVILKEPKTPIPPVEGTILSKHHHDRQLKLMVANPSPEALWRIRDHENTIEVKVNVPSLEEIFVAYLESNKQAIKVDSSRSSAEVTTE